MFNNASYKNTIFNHINRNIVYPTLFYNPISLHHNEIPQTGVEIIEITSGDELNAEELNSINQNTTSHIYNTIDNYFTNNSTPEEVNCARREQKHNFKRCINSETAFDRACSEFYGINCDNRGSVYSSNNFFSLKSSSSSETPEGLKVTPFNDTSDECCNSDESYDSHKAYNIIKNANKTWTDCQKDMQYLYRNNESNVTSSQEETSCDNSTDEDEPSYNNNTINRRATMLPTYMPRLNLPSSPTLPTVTEVFEPSKTPVNLSGDNDASSLFQKSLNNWFNDEIETNENKNFQQGNRLSTIFEREKRKIKLKEIQEQDILEEKYFKFVNLETTKRYISLEKIDNIAIQTFLNDDDTAIEVQKPHIKTSTTTSPQSTKVSDPKEKNQENCNENSNDSDVIEVYDCDLNTTPEPKDDSIKKEIIGNNVLVKTNSNPSDRYSTNCVPPLRFSFIVESDPESRSCLKRILTFIRCCK